MKNYWQEVKLGDICEYSRNRISISEVNLCNYVSTENLLKERAGKTIADSIPEQANLCEYNKGCTLISNIRPYFKKIWFANTRGGCSNDVLVYKPNNGINDKWLYYLLSQDSFFDFVMSGTKGTKMPRGDKSQIMKFPVALPPLDEQKKIAGILSALDDKIELNNKINRNLEAQAQAIFKSWFIDTQNLDRKLVRVRDFFDISIGKTPPRKEPNWFSDNDADVPWVSISDMGDCGTFISCTSEYLTQRAISMFNIRLVPDNTVLLSFKLTIGRIAITDGEMATNEAIAHFISHDKYINEYLYCYLKNFNFQTIGNTSSIAIAVNSKIIKDMPFTLPTKEEVMKFHSITNPIFNTIKSNQRESNRLANIRNTLLPKLISGEFNFSNIEA